jgi:hypothetical protein
MADKAGEMIDFENTTPISYAKALAYLPDPSTIRSRVIDQFGKARAPSLDQCRNLRLAYLGQRTARQSRCQERYGRNFKCSHPQTEENTIITIDGIDTCKTCAKMKQEKDSLQKQLEIELAAAKLKAHLEAQERIETARVLYEAALRDAAAAKEARVWMLGSEVIEIVAQLFMIKPDDIIAGSRFERYVDARATVAQILRNRELSYARIGRIMKRDHSTIINLITKIEHYKARNPMIEHVLGIVT